MILLFVLTANVAFIGAAAVILSWLSPPTLENDGFWHSAFNTIIMYLGIGGIETVVEDINQTNVLLLLTSIVIVTVGLVFFTYALIGYMSDFISSIIGSADSNSKKLHILHI